MEKKKDQIAQDIYGSLYDCFCTTFKCTSCPLRCGLILKAVDKYLDGGEWNLHSAAFMVIATVGRMLFHENYQVAQAQGFWDAINAMTADIDRLVAI